MKKITRLSVATALLGAALALPGTMRAQRLSVFTVAQQNRIDSLKQDYIRKGCTEEFAVSRATAIVKSENRAQLRSRVTPPSATSIWVDRNPADFTQYHPVYHTYTPEQFVKKVLLKNPAAESAITNVQFRGYGWNGSSWTGVDRSLNYFENGKPGSPSISDFPNGKLGIERGLLLATGPTLDAEGPNSSSGGMSGGTPISDPDLSSICSAVKSGSVLEFDFVPYTDKATFDFVFASEEYGNYSNQHNVNDAFGFFVSKVGVPGVTNIAKFPNDSAVTISNSNWGYNMQGSQIRVDLLLLMQVLLGQAIHCRRGVLLL